MRQCDESFETPRYRYILSVTAVDDTGHSWLTLFNDTAEKLLDGHSATEMSALKDAGEAGAAQWSAIFQAANFRQYLFRVKVRVSWRPGLRPVPSHLTRLALSPGPSPLLQVEDINGDTRTRASAVGMTPVDYARENKVLLDAIKQYEAMPSR